MEKKLETKTDFRRAGIAKRDELSYSERGISDRMILQHLMDTEIWNNAGILLCYVDFKTEADTREILMTALAEGKEVYCPKVLDKEKMEFYRIHNLHELAPGCMSIQEPFFPETETKERSFKEQINDRMPDILMLLPGAAFDKKGRRIGYGGGYYDRYLGSLPQIPLYTMGLAYSVQIFDMVPHDSLDIPAQSVMTELGIVTEE
ncbi:MAG: 5-formyltetrahydrofolate cyclo-ligase [Lachnospiraceae bacterium]|nr:5-formyltetrahydrofolate cyclo-ligase [Lachnospiraceae bacterium]